MLSRSVSMGSIASANMLTLRESMPTGGIPIDQHGIPMDGTCLFHSLVRPFAAIIQPPRVVTHQELGGWAGGMLRRPRLAGGWHALAQREHGFDRLREHAHAAREHANRPRKKSVKSEIILDGAVPHGSTRPRSDHPNKAPERFVELNGVVLVLLR